MERFDIVNEAGLPTGETISREEAHAKGIMHRTAHVWIVRKGEKWQVLLQKRSDRKDSFPGLYDTSCAGHISAGEEPLPSAMRELQEELGIAAAPSELIFAGNFRIQYGKEFHGRLFRDNEVAFVYVYTGQVELEDLRLQAEEVSGAAWFPIDEVWEEIKTDRSRFCVPREGLHVLRQFLSARGSVFEEGLGH